MGNCCTENNNSSELVKKTASNLSLASKENKNFGNIDFSKENSRVIANSVMVIEDSEIQEKKESNEELINIETIKLNSIIAYQCNILC